MPVPSFPAGVSVRDDINRDAEVAEDMLGEEHRRSFRIETCGRGHELRAFRKQIDYNEDDIVVIGLR